MSRRTQPISPESPTTSQSPPGLGRGQACIICRRKKMRCDGVRPFCGQCSLTRRPEDCEYTDKQGRTQTEVLEERLRLLKERLVELESQPKSASDVLLHNPYSSSPSKEFADIQIPSLISRSPISGIGIGQSAGPDVDMGSLQDTATANFLQAAPAVQLQPEENFFELLQIFIPHAPHLSFALHVPSLLRTSSLPPSHPDHPHDCLISAISLWAYRLLSPEMQYSTRERAHLARSLATLPSALASAAPNHRVQVVQAELLLSLYFFHEARLLEGRYHASAAASAALGCGLHRIDLESVNLSHVGQPTSGKLSSSFGTGAGLSLGSGCMLGLGSGQLLLLPPPRDTLELGERINVFWAVYTLDRRWSVALGCPPAICNGDFGIRISTPLPRRLEDYENMSVDEVLTSGERISAYVDVDGPADFSKLSLPSSEHLAGVVAAALFERATRLVGGQFDSGIPPTPDFLKRVDALDAVIRRFNGAFSTAAGVTATTPPKSPPVNPDPNENTSSPEAERGNTNKDKGKDKAPAPPTPIESRTNLNPFPIAQTPGTPTSNQREHTTALTRSLGHAAIIQLYCALAQVQTQDEDKSEGDDSDEPQSQFLGRDARPDACARCFSAAREIVLILQSGSASKSASERGRSTMTNVGETHVELGEMDFFIGIIWLSAVRILSSEAVRLAGLALQMHHDGAGDVRPAGPDQNLYITSKGVEHQAEGRTRTRSGVQEVGIEEVEARLGEIQADLALLHVAMHTLGRTCPLIAAQIGALGATELDLDSPVSGLF